MERGRQQQKVRDPKCSPGRHQEHSGSWNRIEKCGVEDGEGNQLASEL